MKQMCILISEICDYCNACKLLVPVDFQLLELMVLHFITTVVIWNIEHNQKFHLLLAELNSGHGFCVSLCSLNKFVVWWRR